MSHKTIGITGAGGFIGKHFALRAARQDGWTVVTCPRSAFSNPNELRNFVSACDVVVHLAGANRGTDNDVRDVNIRLASELVAALREAEVTPHVVYSSSTQEACDNVYGNSKREAGDIFSQWADETSAPLSILVIPNVYGAGCRPFYNSVVATFCHQLALGETPQVQVDKEVEFICISELVDLIVDTIENPVNNERRKRVNGTAKLHVSELLEILKEFRESYFHTNVVPDLSDRTTQNLYATFLSYLPASDLRHCPQLHTDNRGSLVEVIKLAQGGQVFFSTTKPGITRGNHYHTRKVEWFCVLKGNAVIRLRRLDSNDVQEFPVSGDRPEFISIPVMHTHHIENVGQTELLTMFWCNEIFDNRDADTFMAKVA